MHVCISQKMKFKICNGFTGYNGYCVGVLMETVMVLVSTGNWSPSISGLLKPYPNGMCPKMHYRKPFF